MSGNITDGGSSSQYENKLVWWPHFLAIAYKLS